MAKRTIVACVCVFFCIAMLSLGCKKGCGTCRSYGYSNGASYNNGGYTNYYYLGYTGQVCVNSFCTCPNGLEGDSCKIFSIVKYLQPTPSWQVSDACNGTTYGVTMIASSSPNTYNNVFYMSGLFNLGTQVEVDILSSANNQGTSLYIPQQTIGAVSFSGNGLYSSSGGQGRISFNMDYIANGIESNCTLYLSQQ